MSYKTSVLLLASILSLTACNGQPAQTAAPAASASVAASGETVASSVPTTPTESEIKSSDGTVSFVLAGEFVNKLNDAEFGADKNTTLLQYDDSRNLTVSAVDSGSLKGKIDTFTNHLKQSVEGNKTLNNAKFGTDANHRITYQFSHVATEDKPAANESCVVAVLESNKITTVCATSTDMSADDLATLLANNVKFH